MTWTQPDAFRRPNLWVIARSPTSNFALVDYSADGWFWTAAGHAMWQAESCDAAKAAAESAARDYATAILAALPARTVIEPTEEVVHLDLLTFGEARRRPGFIAGHLVIEMYEGDERHQFRARDQYGRLMSMTHHSAALQSRFLRGTGSWSDWAYYDHSTDNEQCRLVLADEITASTAAVWLKVPEHRRKGGAVKYSKRDRAEAIEALMTCAAWWQQPHETFDGPRHLADILATASPPWTLALDAFAFVDYQQKCLADIYASAASLLDAGWEP